MCEKNEMQSFKIKKNIIQTMIDSGLDPTEFRNFMTKYGEFIEYGLLFKKIEAVGRPEFDDLTVINALSTGINCFGAFLTDFNQEFMQKSMNKKYEEGK